MQAIQRRFKKKKWNIEISSIFSMSSAVPINPINSLLFPNKQPCKQKRKGSYSYKVWWYPRDFQASSKLLKRPNRTMKWPHSLSSQDGTYFFIVVKKPKPIKNTSVGHNLTPGNTVLHCTEHGHCSLFWAHPTCTILMLLIKHSQHIFAERSSLMNLHHRKNSDSTTTIDACSYAVMWNNANTLNCSPNEPNDSHVSLSRLQQRQAARLH